MDLGSLELQIFVSLTVVLGAAFVALICDYLKGNNEQLREHNIELRVRKEEQERRMILDPVGFVSHFLPTAANAEGMSTAAVPSQEPAAIHEVMKSYASANSLDEAARRAAALHARLDRYADLDEMAEVPPMTARRRNTSSGRRVNRPTRDHSESFDWVRPEVLARVARKAESQAPPPDVREDSDTPDKELTAPLNAPEKWDIREELGIRRKDKHRVNASAVAEPDLGVPKPQATQVEPTVVSVAEPVATVTPEPVVSAKTEVEPAPPAPPVHERGTAVEPVAGTAITLMRPLTLPQLTLGAEIHRLATAGQDNEARPEHSDLIEEIIAASLEADKPALVAPEEEPQQKQEPDPVHIGSAEHMFLSAPDVEDAAPPSLLPASFSEAERPEETPIVRDSVVSTLVIQEAEPEMLILPDEVTPTLETPVILEPGSHSVKEEEQIDLAPTSESESTHDIEKAVAMEASAPSLAELDPAVDHVGTEEEPAIIANVASSPEATIIAEEMSEFAEMEPITEPVVSQDTMEGEALSEPEVPVLIEAAWSTNSWADQDIQPPSHAEPGIEEEAIAPAAMASSVAQFEYEPQPSAEAGLGSLPFLNLVFESKLNNVPCLQLPLAQNSMHPASGTELGAIAEPPPVVEPPPVWEPDRAVTSQQSPIDISTAREPYPFPEAIAIPTPTDYPDLLLPAGMHDTSTWTRLINLPNPMTGIVVVISLQSTHQNEGEKKQQIREYASSPAVEKLMLSFLREGDFGCQIGNAEWVLVYSQDPAGLNQRRVASLSERLWDFQLRQLGMTDINFQWGAVSVSSEKLREAAQAARDRQGSGNMNRAGLRRDPRSAAAPRKAVNA